MSDFQSRTSLVRGLHGGVDTAANELDEQYRSKLKRIRDRLQRLSGSGSR